MTGRIPERGQPYATVVTKDYPDDRHSNLDPPGRYPVNVHVAHATYIDLTGQRPGASFGPTDNGQADVVLPHLVYGAHSWIAVVNPGERTMTTVAGLLRAAHQSSPPPAE